MADVGSLVVELRFRPLWQRIARLPFTFWRHYRILRDPYRYEQKQGRIICAYAAWIMSGLTVRRYGKKAA